MKEFLWMVAALYAWLMVLLMVPVVVGGIGYGATHDWRLVLVGLAGVPVGLLFARLAEFCMVRT